ncbi:ferritin-like domain-containing protein [Hymenobacter sp. BT491]|uniref:ferritin-like domain-containing protein n=1 Tax=Hymenobacter sp. BT491 TaxID=2766779 RepID=UPI001653C246|nr:ferritin-like domain-containing protein [Hymenobacter sp. BT491]MBC6991425.1 ferritin-like domain-containing protein [Hymenobacter sp. BT491]
MSKLPLLTPESNSVEEGLNTPLQRRSFLRYTGLGVAATSLALTGCNDVLEEIFKNPKANKNEVNVGSGDFGILNYAYALEQLEAAFYAQVVASPYYAGASAAERQILQDVAAHEVAHRDFFKKAITALGGSPIKDLEPDFSAINFSDRTSVLTTAKAFEDLGVSAYNGAGKLIANPDYLTLAGKIVSVEARHAALIRDLIQNGSFVGPDVVDFSTGLEKSKSPAEVVITANAFLKKGSKLNVSNLPKE